MLVKRCKQGDSAAMERLILRYQNRIYNVIFRICANVDDAAELTQDTFVKVLEKINDFQGRSSFYTWVFRIAVNLTLNYCKRSVKLGLRSLDASDFGDYEQSKKELKRFLSDDEPGPEAIAENNELCDIVMRSLMQLDDAQRTVLVLRDIEGMDYAGIAKVLDIKLGTVKSRLSRARSNLREIVEVFLK
jgi:RNA polymerase sigma-70 factor (ECF subfamily)